MKNLIALLSLFVAITCCNAQIELEVNKEGVYRIKEDAQEWAPLGISADLEAIKYIDRFSEAIDNPGAPVLVERSEKTLKLKPVFKRSVEVKEKFIVYTEKSNNISFFVDSSTKQESSYLVLFSVLLILLMMVSNILFKRIDNNFVLFRFIIIVITTVTIIAIAVATSNTIITVMAVIAAFIAIFTVAIKTTMVSTATCLNVRHYKVASILFYIFMITHIVLLFI